jgi:hypothetical protein
MWAVREGPTKHLMTSGMFQSYVSEYQKRSEMADLKGIRAKLRYFHENVWKKRFRWDSEQQRIVEVE